MTWSYSGDPSTHPRDAVRFLIGDTDEADPAYADEELDYLLAQHGSVILAAAEALEGMARRLAAQASFAIGRYREDLTDAARALNAKAAELRQASVAMAAGIYAGGLSVAEKLAVAADLDRVAPRFRVGMHEDPERVNERRGV